MRKSIVLATLCGMLGCSVPAFADASAIPNRPTHSLFAVADIGCGVPAGCYGELGFRPWYFLKMEVGAGYNGMAPGVIGSIVLDPIPWGFGLTLSADAGHYWSGPVPFMNNPPSIEYSYISPMVGLEFGNYRTWRFYLRGGVSYLDMTGSNINVGSDSSLAVGNLKAKGWAAPAFKIGVSFYF